ncbi:hypothetical protein [Aquimarina sp. 2201CG14-23]|uniref:hypothetical protein n=1 Tax=Aquimarina mycalae TaxID=3040073 RepID=UPI002477D53B|nr:hypothetical protein [Aquimarina sp. 2201CG14-23]MDH7445715.1 hypothetical protein [Aquimarina sp. 2201CG14-23]
MLKNVSNLGKTLNKNEQKSILGGLRHAPSEDEHICFYNVTVVDADSGLVIGLTPCNPQIHSFCCEE